MEDGRHLGMVKVSGELLRDHLFRQGEPGRWYRVEHGIPPDATFVRLFVDNHTGELGVVYEHESFPLVYPGHPVPRLDVPRLASLDATVEDVMELDARRRADGVKPVAGNWTPLKAGVDYESTEPLAAFSEVTLTAKPWLFGPPQITAEMAADISPNLPVPNLADYLDLSRLDSADTPTVVGG